jgi:hypothetical protein
MPKREGGLPRATEANPKRMEPTDHAIAVFEQMIATTKTNREKMEAAELKAIQRKRNLSRNIWRSLRNIPQ